MEKSPSRTTTLSALTHSKTPSSTSLMCFWLAELGFTVQQPPFSPRPKWVSVWTKDNYLTPYLRPKKAQQWVVLKTVSRTKMQTCYFKHASLSSLALIGIRYSVVSLSLLLPVASHGKEERKKCLSRRKGGRRNSQTGRVWKAREEAVYFPLLDPFYCGQKKEKGGRREAKFNELLKFRPP